MKLAELLTSGQLTIAVRLQSRRAGGWTQRVAVDGNVIDRIIIVKVRSPQFPFKKFFDINISTVVFDLGKGPIEKDED